MYIHVGVFSFLSVMSCQVCLPAATSPSSCLSFLLVCLPCLLTYVFGEGSGERRHTKRTENRRVVSRRRMPAGERGKGASRARKGKEGNRKKVGVWQVMACMACPSARQGKVQGQGVRACVWEIKYMAKGNRHAQGMQTKKGKSNHQTGQGTMSGKCNKLSHQVLPSPSRETCLVSISCLRMVEWFKSSTRRHA